MIRVLLRSSTPSSLAHSLKFTQVVSVRAGRDPLNDFFGRGSEKQFLWR